MANIVKICRKCMENKEEYIKYHSEIFKDFPKDFINTLIVGYYTTDEDDFCCKIHPNETTIDSKLSYEEFYILSSISSDYNFMQAMENLKEKDIIEFNLKMSQFKSQLGQQSSNSTQDNKVHCKYCNSTNVKKISGLSKAGSVAMWGIFSKKVHKEWHCNNCGSDF